MNNTDLLNLVVKLLLEQNPDLQELISDESGISEEVLTNSVSEGIATELEITIEQQLKPIACINVNSNGSVDSQFGGVSCTRISTGQYRLTPPNNAISCSYHVLDTSTVDSIEIHSLDFIATNIQIHEGDNGANKNYFRDRAFSVTWYGSVDTISNVKIKEN